MSRPPLLPAIKLVAPVVAGLGGTGESAAAAAIRGGFVVADGRVDAISAAPYDDFLEIDLTGAFVLPGLVNCHDHLQFNGAPELRPDRRFRNWNDWMVWLQGRVGPEGLERGRHPGLDAPLEARLWHGALKNALSGVTTVAHHDPVHPILEDARLPVRLAPCGWAHSPGLAGIYGPTLEQSWREAGPDRKWIVHLAEGLDDRAADEFGVLANAGFLDQRTVAVHAVGLDDADRRRLMHEGGGAIWCPSSNLAMLGATLDPRQWVDSAAEGGYKLGLGTDSRLTGADDLFEELRVAAETSGLVASELARFVTVDGAGVLGLDEAGRLEPGLPADLVVIRRHGEKDPWRALLQSSRADLRVVVLGGKPVIADPDLLPWFDHLGIVAVEVRLDGSAKLLAKTALGPAGAAELEPGLEVLR